MNIIVDAGGQTCNRFFEYLYYLKKAILNHEKLKVLIPDITIEDYPKLTNNAFISFPLYSHILSKVIGLKRNFKLIAFIKRIFINQHLQFFYYYLSGKRWNFVIGQQKWIEDEDYSMIRETLKELFMPKDSIRIKVDSIIDKIPSNTVIVGVHIRWGDYKTWRNGQYYFTEETYHNYMKTIARQLKDTGKETHFLIATNGNVHLEHFEDLSCIRIPKSSASEDLYALSKCNYIIGPLSSYSTWISLVYNIPMYCIETKDDYETLSLAQFSPAKNYQYKENGYMFPRGLYFTRNLNK